MVIRKGSSRAKAQYAREHDISYLGMQVAVIEFAHHVCGLPDASSGELAPNSPHKGIDFLPDQDETVSKSGTLRLSAYPCSIAEGTVMRRCYGVEEIRERHRHRYEFNNDYRAPLEE